MNGSRAARLLLVDDDRTFRVSTAELLREDGHDVRTAADGEQAGRLLEEEDFDLVLLDLRMPGLDGNRIVEVLRTRGIRIPVLMISGYGTVDSAVESLHLGADDFLTKPVDPAELSRRVASLLENRPTGRYLEENRFAGMVGRSAGMREVFESVRRVAPQDTTVLVTGETGTGKELVARALHGLSERSAGPFVPVNCAALSEGVLESELFGHLRGSFTGAVEDRQGLFRAADAGTLFLDEVGDMGRRVQQRLLRVLEEREVTPVGGERPVQVDVRVVAATHRDLAEEVDAGRFREDLFYRLNVFHVHLPPLRERRSDLPILVRAGLDRIRERSRGPVPEGCTALAMRLLQAYRWPGNVRELFSVLESAAIRAGGDRIEAHHLPAEVRTPEPKSRGRAAGGTASAKRDARPERGSGPRDGRSTEPIRPGNDDREEPDAASSRYRAPSSDREEREAIEAALQATGGKREEAAALLGMSRTTLWRKMRDYDIEPPG